MAALYGRGLRRMPTNAAFEAIRSTDADGDATVRSPPGAENKPLRHMTWQKQGFTAMVVMLHRVPPETTTLDIYTSMLPLALLSIDIMENNKGERTGSVRVRLVPPPFNYWYDHSWRLQLAGPPPSEVLVYASVDSNGFRGSLSERIQTPLRHWVQPQTDFRVALMSQGFMYRKRAMMLMDEIHDSPASEPNSVKDTDIGLTVDFLRRELCIFVRRHLQESSGPEGPAPATVPARRRLVHYRITIRFSWIKSVWQQRLPGGRLCIMISLSSPPEYWHKVRDLAKTHGNDRLSWNGLEQWVRMAYLTMDQRAVRDAAISLRGKFPKGAAVDLGRWTTFRLGLNQISANEWSDVSRYLKDYDIRVSACPEFQFLPRDDRSMWDCLDNSPLGLSQVPTSSSNTHHLSRQLSFEVAYQLEVCISRGILQEHSLDVVFLESLVALSPDRASRVLEYVAERGKRIYQPHSIFRDPKAASYWRKTPPEATLDKDRAVYIRKAVVTPTTVVFSTPALEAGNRVLRHYREHHDRFLRVQFTDEMQIGRLSGGPDTKRTDECFTRAFRALKNGIRVGGRHFKFLAFGNSQLRENGAYFFAPTELVTCQDIRDWMGDFSSIKTVAKYAARLGQCLSTTRPVPTFGVPTTVQHIPDVENGGFCFTDGVGKISKWWARVIASHLRVSEVPSAFQFRMGGCKGVLAVWPDVPSGQVVQVRPSQEKFPTSDKANVLEIVRCSETATATLNQQTILLLTCLGIPTSVFLDLLAEELTGIDAVMKDARKAVDQLMVRVDQNHTTHAMADMVKAGFMDSDEPFVWALLQLWRSWTLKALKEKARITVEQSAFILGCVDETDTLRGHSNETDTASNEGDQDTNGDSKGRTSQLPQIFLQVPDLGDVASGQIYSGVDRDVGYGKYKVITGLCLVGRNPSLHPGDLRVVEAVDVQALHHLRDVVVFPRVGDRDIPGMCSGGDLDGDDYFVFWDKRLLPSRQFWNYEAMNYEATREPDVDRVTPRHLISFFVQHMKHDTLPRIALSHRGFADQLDGGAMHSRCLELAQLHSQAVDYAKTGVPALMPHRLTPKQWPHWMSRIFKHTYKSPTTLGKIYDRVKVDSFEPAYDKPFDARILRRYPHLDLDLLRRARRIKTQYDLALRRAMAQKEIGSEFEMWSGFSINRPRVGSDYKASEDIGRIFKVIMGRFRRLCVREAGGSQDITKLGPFIAAMYKVTQEEVRIALHEFEQSHDRARKKGFHNPGQLMRSRLSQKNAPLISFPWLFPQELSSIAKAFEMGQDVQAGNEESPSGNGTPENDAADAVPPGEKAHQQGQTGSETRGASSKEPLPPPLSLAELADMEYCVQNGVPTHHGVPLDITAYDASLEDDEDSSQEEDRDGPMWALPPGKSEEDIVIGLAGPAVPSNDLQQDNDFDDDDYNKLNLRAGGFAARDKGEPQHNAGLQHPFPWTEIDDDIISTTSEESIGEDGDGKVVLPLDKEEAGLTEKASDAAEIRASAELRVGLAAAAADDADEIECAGVKVKAENEVLVVENEQDIFTELDRLFGEQGGHGQETTGDELVGQKKDEETADEDVLTSYSFDPGSNVEVLQSLFANKAKVTEAKETC